MSTVQCKDLVKQFGRLAVVDSISVDIDDGEFMVFVGPSGCGKSTTLRMIGGLESVTSGEIYIDRQLMNQVEPRRRDIAMVFQNYALYPHYKVFDNIAYALRLRKRPRLEIQQRVRDTARMLQIEGLLDRWPRQLSGGERQRVALGRAIVRNPRLFLMDEPLSNLDAQLRVQMRQEIIRLQRALGTTTIYVTHDQVEAMTMGDRIMVMRQGRIQQLGQPDSLYTQPANAFVAQFIGSPAMNLQAGHLESSSVGSAAPHGPLEGHFRRGVRSGDGNAGGLTLITSFGQIGLAADIASHVKPPKPAANGSQAVLWGIRPENVQSAARMHAPKEAPVDAATRAE